MHGVHLCVHMGMCGARVSMCSHVYEPLHLPFTLLTAHCLSHLSTFLKLFRTRCDWPDLLVGNGGISPFFLLQSLENVCLFPGSQNKRWH